MTTFRAHAAGNPDQRRHAAEHSGERHIVQFYEDDEFLCRTVARFAVSAFAAEEPAVIIATASHLASIRTFLDATGFDVTRTTASSHLTLLDADDTIAQLLDGDRPSREKFVTVIGGLIQSVLHRRDATQVRAFGEMVDVLWRAGNSTAALQLEELWNELLSTMPVSLLCGYSLASFHAGQGFDSVCAAHGEVWPSERYDDAGDDDARRREISRLQNRAHALESEIARRNEVERQLRDEVRVSETLRRIGRTLTDELKLETIVQKLTAEATALCRAEFGAFFYNVLDAKGESYMLYTLSGVPREAFANLPMPRNTAVFGPTFRGEGVVRSDDITKDPRYGKNAPHHGMPAGHLPVRSHLAVPVISRNGTVLGGLFFGHSQPAVFSERDEELIVAVSGHAAVAIDNARLYDDERRARATAELAREREARLHTITAALSRALTAEDVARVILRESILPMVGVPAAGLVLLTADGRAVDRVLIEGTADAQTVQCTSATYSIDDDAPVFEAARSGKIVWVVGADEIERRYPKLVEMRHRTGGETWGGVPLVLDGRILGAIGVHCDERRELRADDEQFLAVAAQQCAQALERARLRQVHESARTELVAAHEALQQNVLRLERIQAATSALSRARTPKEVASATVRNGAQAVGAESCIAWILDQDGSLALLDGTGIPTAEIDAWTRLPAGAPLPAFRVIATGEPEFVESEEDYLRLVPTLYERQKRAGRLRSFAAMPMAVGGERRGCITFSYLLGHRFAPAEREFLLTLVRQCEQALERAELFAREADARARAESAKREAEEASRAKDEFLAMLGHELRNPLAPIVTALQLMKLRSDGKSSKEQDVIERQVDHLVRLVDDLLDISKITRGKVQLEKRAIELHGVVARAVEIASPLFEHRGHQLDIDVPRGGIWLDADDTRLAQVIANLLTNAAKYTEPGGRIALRAWRDGHEIVVSVKDNGIGIAPELLPRVFDLFVQGHRAADRGPGGLGIGLALVRNLVALHGGSVVALSDGDGRGSEFVIRLPGVRQVAGADPATTAAPEKPVISTPRRVLVVDDNEDAADLLAEMLSSVGHEVVVAHDGPQALAAIERFLPDVAVLDIGLPVMDGYELAGKLREALGDKTPRLIAATGYGQEHDRERSHVAGFELHFVKPLQPDKLLRAIERDEPA